MGYECSANRLDSFRKMKIKFKFCWRRNYEVLCWRSAVRQHLTSEQVLTGFLRPTSGCNGKVIRLRSCLRNFIISSLKMEALLTQAIENMTEPVSDHQMVRDTYSIPFDRIHGIPVTCSFTIRWFGMPGEASKMNLTLDITSEHFFQYRSDDCESFSLYTYNNGVNYQKHEVERMADELRGYVRLIKKLTFDNFNGKFMIPGNPDVPSWRERQWRYASFHQAFYDFYLVDGVCETIDTSIKECSVCYVKTKSRTECHHPLCWICLSKLKLEDDGNDEPTYASCPYCRGHITAMI